MNSIDLTSLLVGIFATAITGIIVYFLTRILLFKTRISFPHGFDQISDVIEPSDDSYIRAAYLNTFFRVSGWEPARDVVIHVNHPFGKIDFDPDVPFEKDGNKVKINVLKSGVYKIKISDIGDHCYKILKLSAIESSNSISHQRRLTDQKFESIIVYFLPAIVGLVVFTMVSLIVDLVSAIEKGLRAP